MKKSKLRMILRKIVREEVAIAIKEVITELKQPKQKKKIVEKKQYTNNSILNEVLNETEGGILHGTEPYPTMGGGVYDSSKADEIISSQYSDIMKGDTEPTHESNVSTIVGKGAPENVKNLFNKDFSGILKQSYKKGNK